MKKSVLFMVICFGLFLCQCSRQKEKKPEYQTQSRFILDTLCRIQVPGGPEIIPVISGALDRMSGINKKFSIFEKESPVYQFNETGKPIADPEIVSVVKIALEISEKSGGALDITVVPLVRIWGFYTGFTPAVPSADQIREALSKIGYKNIEIRDNQIFKKVPWVQIDLGGIAKGYAVEAAARFLRERGIRSALVDGGGNIYALGKKPDGKPWRVGIQDPRGKDAIASIEVEDMAVVSSGDYERFFIQDKVRYHHIMDPRTGKPARGAISATIIMKSSQWADGWSKPMFILGTKKALELAATVPGLECLIITEDLKKYVTPGLKGRITVLGELSN